METLEVASSMDWHSWLKKNHLTCDGIWLVFRRKNAGESISYDEALDEALAHGWVDSIIKKIDNQKYPRKFTPRRPGSIWSSLNIARVKRLTREGRMTEGGIQAFEKNTGKISLMEKINAEAIQLPPDLVDALRKNKKAWTNFEKFTPSYRKRYLTWISGAKRHETRKKRIDEAVALISRNVKALLK